MYVYVCMYVSWSSEQQYPGHKWENMEDLTKKNCSQSKPEASLKVESASWGKAVVLRHKAVGLMKSRGFHWWEREKRWWPSWR